MMGGVVILPLPASLFKTTLRIYFMDQDIRVPAVFAAIAVTKYMIIMVFFKTFMSTTLLS